jgi:hypothetical protein
MNIKRGIAAGVILWVLIFFEVSILMFGFKLTAGTTYYTIHYIALAVIAYISALFYFKGKRVKKNAKEGLKAGIVMLVTAIVLDALITVPLWMGGNYAFFLDPYLIAGLVETLVVVAIAGALKK